MRILVIGSEGSMGRRYTAILHTIKDMVPVGYDPTKHQAEPVLDYDRYIIASPTDTHEYWLRKLASLGKPVLCEKPIIKDSKKVREVVELYKEHNTPLTMVMQYRHYVRGAKGQSEYNYYNHGKDGLFWDCLQVIALTEGHVTLGETSTVWSAKLNDINLNIAQMDTNYVYEIIDWIRSPIEGGEFYIEAHERVEKMIAYYEQSKTQSAVTLD